GKVRRRAAKAEIASPATPKFPTAISGSMYREISELYSSRLSSSRYVIESSQRSGSSLTPEITSRRLLTKSSSSFWNAAGQGVLENASASGFLRHPCDPKKYPTS